MTPTTHVPAAESNLSLQPKERNSPKAKPMTWKPEISLTNTRTDFSLHLKLHYLWQESGLNNITGPKKTVFRKMENIQYLTKMLSYHLQLPPSPSLF